MLKSERCFKLSEPKSALMGDETSSHSMILSLPTFRTLTPSVGKGLVERVYWLDLWLTVLNPWRLIVAVSTRAQSRHVVISIPACGIFVGTSQPSDGVVS